jgi:hypothetical protein
VRSFSSTVSGRVSVDNLQPRREQSTTAGAKDAEDGTAFSVTSVSSVLHMLCCLTTNKERPDTNARCVDPPDRSAYQGTPSGTAFPAPPRNPPSGNSPGRWSRCRVPGTEHAGQLRASTCS